MLLLGGPDGLHATLRDVVGEVLDRMYGKPMPNRDQVADGAGLDHSRRSSRRHGWSRRSSTPRWRRAARPVRRELAADRRAWRRSSLPIWLHGALGIAAAAAVFGGAARFIGLNMMIALSVAFCLGGLAVLHAAVRRLSHPTMVLVFFYTMAALFGWPFLVVAVLGLLESWLGLRRRLAPQGAQYRWLI